LFDRLEPKQGPEAVVSVGTLLDRLDQLENSPERELTRAADHAALATLAQRGYTPAERARLRGLIELAQTVAPVAPVSDDERQAILHELHAWFIDWSTTARSVLDRRDHQIRLGLARRRKSKTDDPLKPKKGGAAVVHGAANGAANKVTNDAANEVTNGAANGVTNGAANGVTNGAANGAAICG
jgi:hypothetical protein